MIEKKEVVPILYVPIGMLCLAFLSLPYGYYMLLKLVICGSSCYQVFRIYSKEKAISIKTSPLLILFLTYNPIIPIHLGRSIWAVVNVITIAYFIFIVIQVKKSKV